MTLPDPSHPAYAVPCRAEPIAGQTPFPSSRAVEEAHGAYEAHAARAQLQLALRARDGRPFVAAYTASVARVVDPVASVAPDRAQLSLFGSPLGSLLGSPAGR